MPENDETLLPIKPVKGRYGDVSDMWIERRLKDKSGFPKPVYIGRLRFWRLSELIAWEQSLPRKAS